MDFPDSGKSCGTGIKTEDTKTFCHLASDGEEASSWILKRMNWKFLEPEKEIKALVAAVVASERWQKLRKKNGLTLGRPRFTTSEKMSVHQG